MQDLEEKLTDDHLKCMRENGSTMKIVGEYARFMQYEKSLRECQVFGRYEQSMQQRHCESTQLQIPPIQNLQPVCSQPTAKVVISLVVTYKWSIQFTISTKYIISQGCSEQGRRYGVPHKGDVLLHTRETFCSTQGRRYSVAPYLGDFIVLLRTWETLHVPPIRLDFRLQYVRYIKFITSHTFIIKFKSLSLVQRCKSSSRV